MSVPSSEVLSSSGVLLFYSKYESILPSSSHLHVFICECTQPHRSHMELFFPSLLPSPFFLTKAVFIIMHILVPPLRLPPTPLSERADHTFCSSVSFKHSLLCFFTCFTQYFSMLILFLWLLFPLPVKKTFVVSFFFPCPFW